MNQDQVSKLLIDALIVFGGCGFMLGFIAGTEFWEWLERCEKTAPPTEE